MKISDLIRIEKHKSRGVVRSHDVYIAQCGVVTCEALARADAEQGMVDIILARLGERVEPVVVIAGEVFVAYQENSGRWAYSINGRCVCQHGEDRNACVRTMKLHAAQGLYSHENHTPTGDYRVAVAIVDYVDREDFAKWWAWQDAYNLARGAGKNDHEARQAADGGT